MSVFLTVLHIMACLVLIIVVLLQQGKGADLGASLGGGGGNTVFGSRGAGNFLTKMTTACAVIFMLTSLSLSYIGTQAAKEQIFDEPSDATSTTPLVPIEDAAAPSLLEEIEPVAPDTANAPEAPEEAPAP